MGMQVYTVRDAARQTGRSVRRCHDIIAALDLGRRVMGGEDGETVIAILLSRADIAQIRAGIPANTPKKEK